MANALHEIGSFQFDNLIRNQIPFLLLNLEGDLTGLYKISVYQSYVERVAVNVTLDSALAALEERHHPQQEAILVICDNGQEAPKLVDQLEAKGYMNVYFVRGGVAELRAGLD